MKNDPYLYPGTDVLINKLGIRNSHSLYETENSLSLIRYVQLTRQPVEGSLDYDHLRSIHKHLYGDLYHWAGDTRYNPLSKVEPALNGKTVNYPDPDHSNPSENLKHRIDDVFSQLKKENYLRNLAPGEFTKSLIHHMNELWKLHPFRKGNAHTQFYFISQLSKQAGYELKATEPGQVGKLRDAMILSADGQSSNLRNILNDKLGLTKNLSAIEGRMKTNDLENYTKYQELIKEASAYSKQTTRDPEKQTAIKQSIIEKILDKYENSRKLPTASNSKTKKNELEL